MVRQGGKYKALNSNRVTFEPGLVERGRVLRPQDLQKVLQNALETARPKPIKSPPKVVFVLPESQVFVHLFSLNDHTSSPTRLAQADLAQIIWQEVRQNVPWAENELLYAYRRRPKEKIFIVAVNKKIVQEWNAFFQGAGLKINFFDAQTLALYRGLFLKAPAEPVCIVDFGLNTINILIYDLSGVRYAYAIPWGGNELVKKIVRALRLSYPKAEEEMLERGLSEAQSKVTRVLIRGLAPLVEEMRASLEYYLKHAGTPVQKIILVGETQLKGLVEYLQGYCDASVEQGHSPLLGTQDSLPADHFYIGALGAARIALDQKWAQRDPAIVFGKEADPKVARPDNRQKSQEITLAKKEIPFEKPKEKRFNVTIKFGQKGRIAKIKKSAIEEETKKRRLLDSELPILKTPAAPPPPRKKHKRKIILGVILICIVVLAGLAFLLRGYIWEQKGAEHAGDTPEQEFAQSQISTLKLPIVLSSPDFHPQQIRGRIIEDVIVQAQDYVEAVNLSRQNVNKILQSQGSAERLWPEPLTLPAAPGEETLFPLAVKWLVYRLDDLEALVQKRIDLLNVQGVAYALQSITERRVLASGDQNLYYLFVDVTLALDELIPEEGEGLAAPDTQTDQTVGETNPIGDTTAPVTEGEIAESPQNYVEILSTDLGWLRVRSGPGLEYTEITKVNSGEKYPFLAEQNSWYKIKLTDGREGWVSGEYAKMSN